MESVGTHIGSMSSRGRKNFRSSESFWLKFMSSIISQHPDSKKNWRVASINESACSLCRESGGVVMKCIEACRKECHPMCSFLFKSGIFLRENDIYLECADHYRPICYCVCKKEYDNDKDEMICCDTCNEWYHHKCVNFSIDSIGNRYSCKNCITMEIEGKQDQLPLRKEKNQNKEIKQAHHSNAMYFFSIIQILLKMCPLIDKLDALEEFKNSTTGVLMATQHVFQDELLKILNIIESNIICYKIGIIPENEMNKLDDNNNNISKGSLPSLESYSSKGHDDDTVISMLEVCGTKEMIIQWYQRLHKENNLLKLWSSQYKSSMLLIDTRLNSLLETNTSNNDANLSPFTFTTTSTSSSHTLKRQNNNTSTTNHHLNNTNNNDKNNLFTNQWVCALSTTSMSVIDGLLIHIERLNKELNAILSTPSELNSFELLSNSLTWISEAFNVREGGGEEIKILISIVINVYLCLLYLFL